MKGQMEGLKTTEKVKRDKTEETLTRDKNKRGGQYKNKRGGQFKAGMNIGTTNQ